jgi:TolB protein
MIPHRTARRIGDDKATSTGLVEMTTPRTEIRKTITWTRVTARFSLALLALLLLLAAVALLIAAGSPVGRMMAFMSNRDGDWDVYLLDMSRGVPMNMTDELGMAANAVGTPSPDNRYPAWSPDGRRLAYHANPNGTWELYLLNADGTGLEQLTNNFADDAMPVWSPDGTRLIYHSNRNGDWDIYVMDLESRRETRLTFYAGEDTFASWSPDGESIVYVSNRDGDTEVYIRRGLNEGSPAGSDYSLQMLTDNFASDWSPAWSPDGQWIAYVTNLNGTEDIYISSVDGSRQWRLTQADSNEKNPVWLPDGTGITLVSDLNGLDREQVYIVPFRDGSVPPSEWRRVTNDGFSNWSPEWQPLPQDPTAALITPEIQPTPQYEATATAYSLQLTAYQGTANAYWTAIATSGGTPPIFAGATATPSNLIPFPVFPTISFGGSTAVSPPPPFIPTNTPTAIPSP